MKHSKTTIILTIIISILLFVLGFIIFGDIYEFILPKVDNGFYQVTELNGPFMSSLIFSITLGLTPVLLLLTWQLAPIILKSKKITSIVTVVVCMTLAILVRQQMIKSYFSRLTTLSGEKLKVSYPMNQVNFEYYLLGGLCIGCIISYFLFKQKKGFISVGFSQHTL